MASGAKRRTEAKALEIAWSEEITLLVPGVSQRSTVACAARGIHMMVSLYDNTQLESPFCSRSANGRISVASLSGGAGIGRGQA